MLKNLTFDVQAACAKEKPLALSEVARKGEYERR
jgi:hypothetical protein